MFQFIKKNYEVISILLFVVSISLTVYSLKMTTKKETA